MYSTLDIEPSQREAFSEWLQPLEMRVFVQRDHGQWYAVLESYNIAGVGEDTEAAVNDAIGLLVSYLYSEFVDGKAWDATERPIPWQTRLKFRALVAAARVHKRLRPATASDTREIGRTVSPAEYCMP